MQIARLNTNDQAAIRNTFASEESLCTTYAQTIFPLPCQHKGQSPGKDLDQTWSARAQKERQYQMGHAATGAIQPGCCQKACAETFSAEEGESEGAHT